MEQKYYKVKEIAQMYSLRPVQVRWFCHAKGQRFASQPSGRGGCLLINLEKFEKWMQMQHPEYRRSL